MSAYFLVDLVRMLEALEMKAADNWQVLHRELLLGIVGRLAEGTVEMVQGLW